MSRRTNLGRELRSLWATLAAICLLGAGIAYGVTWYRQGELERAATRDARRLVVDVLQPLLSPADADGPIRGARYDELLAAVREDVLAGPINGVRIWQADGTVLFADDASLVGDRDPGVRDEVDAATGGTAEGVVDGERFRIFSALRVGQPAEVLAAELDRSHTAIVEAARKPWYPWFGRALFAAGTFGVLFVLTAIAFGVLGVLERRSVRRRNLEPVMPTRSVKRERPAPKGDQPAYMHAGFEEEVLARRKAEEALEALRQERNTLLDRIRRLEAELEDARHSPEGAGLTRRG